MSLLRATSITIAVASVFAIATNDAFGDGYIPASDKGNFQYSAPPAYAHETLDLGKIERQVAALASERCGTPLAAAPLDLGDAQSFMSKMLGKAANAAIGQLVGGLLGGGGGGSKKKPPMHKDPVKKKYTTRLEHPVADARIRIGAQQMADGMVMSARVEKAKGKGTFHTMFLEKPDCTRIWPEQYLRYGLWGSWSFSVSVTRTTSTYRNGQLVDRTVDRSGWSRSGDFDFSRGFSLWDQLPGEAQRLVLDADQAYLSQLRNEIDVPAWQQAGFEEPVEGLRAAGGVFRVTPDELTPDTLAVVHITNVEDGRYRTIGFPMRMVPGEKGHLIFEMVPPG